MSLAGSATDINAIQRSYQNLGVPLDILATQDQGLTNGGWTSTVGKYAGPAPYQAGDSPDSNVIPVAGRYYHAWQVVSQNQLSYSIQCEGSLDGVNWKMIGAAVTADGIQQFTGLYKFIRFNLTAWTTVASPSGVVGLSVRYLARS